MALLTPHRFTVEDYYRMAETGVLSPDARVELLEGEVIDIEPIGHFHGSTVTRLNRLFTDSAGRRWTVAVQNPLRLSRHSEPQPDLMLLRYAPGDYWESHPTAEDVFLLVEVAYTSLDYDRNRKLPVYGKAGVPEVWIVNLEESLLEVYREPHFLGYGSKTTFKPEQEVSPAAFADLKIATADLLRRAR